MKNSAIFMISLWRKPNEKAAAILDEHKAALEKMAEEHKTLSEENAQTQIKAENCQRPT
mgnify:CR=1 FL=1